MALTTAERNRRKRERKKKEREQQKSQLPQEKQQPQEDDDGNRSAGGEEEAARSSSSNAPTGTGIESVVAAAGAAAAASAEGESDDTEIEVEYVPEPIQLPEDQFADVLRAVQQQQQAEAASSHVVSDEDENGNHKTKKKEGGAGDNDDDEEDDDDDDDDGAAQGRHVSKRKLRELLRPTVAELKKRVKRPDLVEAHDVTAREPEFLISLKAAPGTVPVPRHWGRKRKYLQGKRGFEKKPFQLPDFIVSTGITEVRDAAAREDSDMSAKQRNRMRVAPKMGAIDVDYKVLYDAFFKHQTKPANLTKFGELYYEGKELEAKTGNIKPGWPYSKQLREALGMVLPTSPPPWLVNMQRYGPPPSYPGMKIPGLNAPLPTPECQYGYHPGGWGKPPLDPYGRPLYGGNPFDPPGSFGRSSTDDDGPFGAAGTLVTSDGKTLGKSEWGALPTGEALAGAEDEEESDEEEESGSEMEESDEEGEEAMDGSGMESVLPPPPMPATAPKDLRKLGAGDETPLPSASSAMGQPKPLYRVIEQTQTSTSQQLQAGAVFASEVAYVVPGANLPEGAESVLSKAPDQVPKRKAKDAEDDDDDGLDKKFKF